MPKCNLKENHGITVTGILDSEQLTVEIEDIGVRSLSALLNKFNGCPITLTINEKIEHYK